MLCKHWPGNQKPVFPVAPPAQLLCLPFQQLHTTMEMFSYPTPSMLWCSCSQKGGGSHPPCLACFPFIIWATDFSAVHYEENPGAGMLSSSQPSTSITEVKRLTSHFILELSFVGFLSVFKHTLECGLVLYIHTNVPGLEPSRCAKTKRFLELPTTFPSECSELCQGIHHCCIILYALLFFF